MEKRQETKLEFTGGGRGEIWGDSGLQTHPPTCGWGQSPPTPPGRNQGGGNKNKERKEKALSILRGGWRRALCWHLRGAGQGSISGCRARACPPPPKNHPLLQVSGASKQFGRFNAELAASSAEPCSQTSSWPRVRGCEPAAPHACRTPPAPKKKRGKQLPSGPLLLWCVCWFCSLHS